MVPEGGVEPPQGYPYWILSLANLLSTSIYQGVSHRIKDVFPPVLPRCARYVLLVWAQFWAQPLTLLW